MPFIFRFSSFWEWRFERESIGLFDSTILLHLDVQLFTLDVRAKQ